MYTSQLLGITIALVGASMANPVPQMDNVAAIGDLDGRDVIYDPTATSPSACTTVIPILPSWTWGPTRTIWTTTTTATKDVDCGRCTAIARTYFPFGVPPVVIFTTTTTVAGPSPTTVLRCGKPTGIASAAPGPAVTKAPEHTLTPSAL